jgi:hypothetical protein
MWITRLRRLYKTSRRSAIGNCCTPFSSTDHDLWALILQPILFPVPKFKTPDGSWNMSLHCSNYYFRTIFAVTSFWMCIRLFLYERAPESSVSRDDYYHCAVSPLNVLQYISIWYFLEFLNDHTVAMSTWCINFFNDLHLPCRVPE